MPSHTHGDVASGRESIADSGPAPARPRWRRSARAALRWIWRGVRAAFLSAASPTSSMHDSLVAPERSKAEPRARPCGSYLRRMD